MSQRSGHIFWILQNNIQFFFTTAIFGNGRAVQRQRHCLVHCGSADIVICRTFTIDNNVQFLVGVSYTVVNIDCTVNGLHNIFNLTGQLLQFITVVALNLYRNRAGTGRHRHHIRRCNFYGRTWEVVYFLLQFLCNISAAAVTLTHWS